MKSKGGKTRGQLQSNIIQLNNLENNPGNDEAIKRRVAGRRVCVSAFADDLAIIDIILERMQENL